MGQVLVKGPQCLLVFCDRFYTLPWPKDKALWFLRGALFLTGSRRHWLHSIGWAGSSRATGTQQALV